MTAYIAIEDEMAERVGTAVAELPVADREILQLRLIGDPAYDEIACLPDSTTEAVRKRYSRTLFRLQKVVGID